MNTDSTTATDVAGSGAVQGFDATPPTAPAAVTVGPVRRHPVRQAGQQLACGWCGEPITLAATGRTPKWCSDTCRHRAWEQSRAAASGRAAVRVVDRQVHVEVPVPVVERVEVPTVPRGAVWAPVLRELTAQLDTGRVYGRDLAVIGDALDAVIAAYNRRARHHR